MNQNTNIRPYKSTNAEVEIRINTVVKLFLQGYTRADIVRYCSRFLISSRQVDTYILKSKNQIRQISAADKEDQLYKALARYEDLYKNCYKNQDWGGCQSIQNSINKLMGLNAESKLKVNLKGSIMPDIWLEENSK